MRLSEIYWNLLHRDIPVRTREVRIADTIGDSPKKMRQAWSVAMAIRSGVDMATYLSRDARRPDGANFHDLLLNDWAIHHLHLRPQGHPKFRQRDLVYAAFGFGEAFLIDVRPHGDWAKQELNDIVERNWPGMIERLPWVEVACPLDDETLLLARGKPGKRTHLTTLATLADGSPIFGNGCGSMSSGLSAWVRDVADRYCEHVVWLGDVVEANFDQFISDGRSSSARLRLEYNSWRGWLAVDTEQRVGFQLPASNVGVLPWFASDLRWPRVPRRRWRGSPAARYITASGSIVKFP